jgi:hypothetical protein
MKTKSRKGNSAVQLFSSKDNEPSIESVTGTYEAWMRSCTNVLQSDLRSKHEQMKDTPFGFLRGAFYRWAQLWPSVCADLCGAPKVLAVGDLHVNSFGTWRDAEGGLCWGVDDFDEAYPLAYTNDLVRQAASLKIVIDAEGLSIKLKDGCNAILDGYADSLRAGGCPIVLAEREQKLGKLGIDSFKPPTNFWEKLNHLPAVRQPLARDLKRALEKTLPERKIEYKVVRRQAGLGSLGQERFVAIAKWQGGYIAREGGKANIDAGGEFTRHRIGAQRSGSSASGQAAFRLPRMRFARG